MSAPYEAQPQQLRRCATFGPGIVLGRNVQLARSDVGNSIHVKLLFRGARRERAVRVALAFAHVLDEAQMWAPRDDRIVQHITGKLLLMLTLPRSLLTQTP
jgi:hypothetical protein